jgi:hypothetical protein
VPGDTKRNSEVFVHDRRTGITERLTVAADGSELGGFSGGSALSSDGRLVAFAASGRGLAAGDKNAVADVFVRDRVSGAIERVSVARAEQRRMVKVVARASALTVASSSSSRPLRTWCQATTTDSPTSFSTTVTLASPSACM